MGHYRPFERSPRAAGQADAVTMTASERRLGPSTASPLAYRSDRSSCWLRHWHRRAAAARLTVTGRQAEPLPSGSGGGPEGWASPAPVTVIQLTVHRMITQGNHHLRDRCPCRLCGPGRRRSRCSPQRSERPVMRRHCPRSPGDCNGCSWTGSQRRRRRFCRPTAKFCSSA